MNGTRWKRDAVGAVVGVALFLILLLLAEYHAPTASGPFLWRAIGGASMLLGSGLASAFAVVVWLRAAERLPDKVKEGD